MNHRHLLPNEIDLLVDGEAGFGVAPLRDHIDECAECRLKFEDARIVVDALESLPHFAPDSRLAERVMSQVHSSSRPTSPRAIRWPVGFLDPDRRASPLRPFSPRQQGC